jgi:RNA polymerase sigma factor (sigma-70 family)
VKSVQVSGRDGHLCCNTHLYNTLETRECTQRKGEHATGMPSSFAEGDEISKLALLELAFQQYADDLYRYIYSKVGQTALAEDLTSTVFLKALRWLQQERSQESVRGWLYATARTTIADYWQEQGQYEHLPLEMMAEEIAEVAELADPALAARLRVQYLLEHLPTRERLILTLRYLHGYSAAEVAHELGLSAGNVRVLQLRALRRAARLEQEERNVTTAMQPPQNSPVTSSLDYTEQMQRVIDLAREEAAALKHGFVGTEHLLLGLSREGSVTPLLDSLGANFIRIRGCLDFLYGGTPLPGKDPNSPPGLTPRAQRVLELAGEEAQRMGEQAVRPQHTLLGILLQGNGIAADMLAAMSIDIDTVRHAIERPNEPVAHMFICSFCHQKTARVIPSNGSSPLRGVLPGRSYICVDCVERFHTMIEQKRA